jgi:chemosensory pili system protein ChpB (putative protein-glutamate methylesterase)
MTENSPKVALLGRPGAAREHLRKALVDLGGEITIEGEPGDLAPEQVAATEPSVVVVSLDAAMEDQLEAWDALFETDGLNVIFDEAETTSQLDGWDLARWARHLAAKILGHDRTLPPAPEGSAPVQGAVDWMPSLGSPATPAAQMDAERLEDYAVEAHGIAGSVPVADDPRNGGPEAGAASEDAPAWSNDVTAIEAEELELDDELAALIAQHDANASQEGVLRFGGTPGAHGDAGAQDAEAEIDFSMEFADGAEPAEAIHEPVGDTPPQASAPDTEAAEGETQDVALSDGSPSAVADVQEQHFSFGHRLELVIDDGDEVSESVVQSDPAPAPEPAPAASADSGKMSFDQLAAAFQLEDDASEDEDEPGTGAVGATTRGVMVLLAGMGGPDALRQLLSALPRRIPVPVVVWQQLNAGTHDRLASQLAKTGKVETAMAKPGESLTAGTVYILPPGVGIDATDGGLRFKEDQGSPAGLLRALEPLGDDAVVVALSGAEAAWLADSAQWSAKGGRLLAQSPETCFEASVCDSLVKQGVAGAPPADLAISALGKWHEDN